MNTIPIVVGLALLLLGYRYYWLIAGGLGFLFGLNIGSTAASGQVTPGAVMLGLLLGVIAALTAVFITKLTLNIAGFTLGGIVLVQLFANLNWNVGSTLVTFLLGGLMGLLTAIFAQDLAKILVSAITGAAILVSALELDDATVSFVYLTCVILSIVAQLILRRRFK